MNRKEVVMLTRTVTAACPQQAMDDYTPDAWFELLGDLDAAEAASAVAVIAKRQPFVAPSEIRAEVKRVRADRLSRSLLSAPSHELADQPGPYAREIRDGIERIADARSIRNALPAGEPLPGDPPPEWRDARKAMAEKSDVPAARDPRDVARAQVAAARARREQVERMGRAEGGEA
jgi:hypothetical protein